MNQLSEAELLRRIDCAKRQQRTCERRGDANGAAVAATRAKKYGQVLAELRTRELFADSRPPVGPDQGGKTSALCGMTATPPELEPISAVTTADEELNTTLKLARFPWARGLRKLCLTYLLNHGAHTADEVAQALKKNPFAIRPRFAELATIGAVKWTGEKRNLCGAGKSQKVWEAL